MALYGAQAMIPTAVIAPNNLQNIMATPKGSSMADASQEQQ